MRDWQNHFALFFWHFFSDWLDVLPPQYRIISAFTRIFYQGWLLSFLFPLFTSLLYCVWMSFFLLNPFTLYKFCCAHFYLFRNLVDFKKKTTQFISLSYAAIPNDNWDLQAGMLDDCGSVFYFFSVHFAEESFFICFFVHHIFSSVVIITVFCSRYTDWLSSMLVLADNFCTVRWMCVFFAFFSNFKL